MGEVACALSMGMMGMAFLGTVAMVIAVPAFALFLMMMVVAMAFGFISVVMMSMMDVFAVSCMVLVAAALLRARGFRYGLVDVCTCSFSNALVRIQIWDSSPAVFYGFPQRLSRCGHLLSDCMVPN